MPDLYTAHTHILGGESWAVPYYGCSLSPGKAAGISCAFWDKKVILPYLTSVDEKVIVAANQNKPEVHPFVLLFFVCWILGFVW